MVPEDGFAIDFFHLMFPEELFIAIVDETNKYARQCIRNKPDPKWYDTTFEEVRAFIALDIFFGVKVLPETRL